MVFAVLVLPFFVFFGGYVGVQLISEFDKEYVYEVESKEGPSLLVFASDLVVNSKSATLQERREKRGFVNETVVQFIDPHLKVRWEKKHLFGFENLPKVTLPEPIERDDPKSLREGKLSGPGRPYRQVLARKATQYIVYPIVIFGFMYVCLSVFPVYEALYIALPVSCVLFCGLPLLCACCCSCCGGAQLDEIVIEQGKASNSIQSTNSATPAASGKLEEKAADLGQKAVICCFSSAETEVAKIVIDPSGVGQFLDRYSRRRVLQWLPLPESVSKCITCCWPELTAMFEPISLARKFVVVFLGFALEACEFVDARGGDKLYNDPWSRQKDMTRVPVYDSLDKHTELIENTLGGVLISFFVLYLVAFPYKNWAANFAEVTLQFSAMVLYCSGIWEGDQVFSVLSCLLFFLLGAVRGLRFG
mmetsp:Transcript_75515/g.214760  ORF Transcript_75515/g.214760 Transcript_75515/m.214760 type:complete len:419 (-) Transcript_75515:818-2074(-)